MCVYLLDFTLNAQIFIPPQETVPGNSVRSGGHLGHTSKVDFSCDY